MNPKFSSLNQVKDYIDILVNNELNYEKDFITNIGWHIIEDIAPAHTLNYIIENEDITYLTADDIRLIYEQMLEKYEPSCGLRQSDTN